MILRSVKLQINKSFSDVYTKIDMSTLLKHKVKMTQANLTQSFDNFVRDFAPFWNTSTHLVSNVGSDLFRMTGISTPEERTVMLSVLTTFIQSVPDVLTTYINNTSSWLKFI